MREKLRRLAEYRYGIPWCVPLWGREEAAVTASCLVTGRVIAGSYGDELAENAARLLSMNYALALNRGMTAIELALRALKRSHRDQVVVPSYICWSVVEAILRAGLTPAFADVDESLHLTKDTVFKALTDRSRAVIVPHLFGSSAPIEDVELLARERGLFLIDDAAQSFGAERSGRRVGTFGDCGIISCGPGKVLSGSGTGLLVTNSAQLYESARGYELTAQTWGAVVRRVLGFWVWRRFRRETYPVRIVLNRVWKMVESESVEPPRKAANLEAGIALRQLNRLNDIKKRLREDAEFVRGAIQRLRIPGVRLVPVTPGGIPVKLVLLVSEPSQKREVIALLRANGIEADGGFVPCHLRTEPGLGTLPVTMDLWQRVVWVPVHISNRWTVERKVQIHSGPEVSGALPWTSAHVFPEPGCGQTLRDDPEEQPSQRRGA